MRNLLFVDDAGVYICVITICIASECACKWEKNVEIKYYMSTFVFGSVRCFGGKQRFVSRVRLFLVSNRFGLYARRSASARYKITGETPTLSRFSRHRCRDRVPRDPPHESRLPLQC